MGEIDLWTQIENKCLARALSMLEDMTDLPEETAATIWNLVETAIAINERSPHRDDLTASDAGIKVAVRAICDRRLKAPGTSES